MCTHVWVIAIKYKTVYVCRFVCVCVCVCVCVHVHVCVSACMGAFECGGVLACMYVYVYMCVGVCVHAHKTVCQVGHHSSDLKNAVKRVSHNGSQTHEQK